MAKAFAIAAYGLGMAGVSALSAYVVLSGLGWWPRGEPAMGVAPYLVNAGWLVLFALQHSGMARQRFKSCLTRSVPASLERSVYVAASGLVTLAQPFVWQPLPGPNAWEGLYWLLAVSVTGAIAVFYCGGCFDHLEFFGLRQAGIGQPAPQPQGLEITGPYRWVRHPLMVATLAFLWGQPTMPSELVFLNGSLTVYILIAIQLEERDLIRRFGQAYLDYRRRVPALIPWRLGT